MKLLWVVDTQNDFFDEPYEVFDWTARKSRMQNPTLPVPGSHSIRENLGKLVKYTLANSKEWITSGTLDAHTHQDVNHFSRWPVHCLKGTPGYFPIHEVDNRDWYEHEHPIPRVPMQKLSYKALEATITPIYNEIVFFEKGERAEDNDPDACNSCRVNPNVAPALEIWKPELIVVCGLALGYCLKEARDYFKELGYKVAVVTDASKEFAAEELALYGKWHAEGDKLVHTHDVLNAKL